MFREPSGEAFGKGTLQFEWRPGGNNIVVAGPSGLVRIYSRYGEPMEEFSINELFLFK